MLSAAIVASRFGKQFTVKNPVNLSNIFSPHSSNFDRRPFFTWLNIIFNRIDQDRIKELGPDRVCAEWLLRNGAAIKYVGSEGFLADYNGLPRENIRFNIEKVDASDSSISHYGFLHFRGCEHIRDVILHNCIYIEDDATKMLKYLQSSLEHLQLSGCPNISDFGVLNIATLTGLKTLELHNLSRAVKLNDDIVELKKALPNCKISTVDSEEKIRKVANRR